MKIDNDVKLDFGYSYQNNKRKEFDIRRGGRTNIPVVDLLLKTHNLMLGFSNIKMENWDFEFDYKSKPFTVIQQQVLVLPPDRFNILPNKYRKII